MIQDITKCWVSRVTMFRVCESLYFQENPVGRQSFVGIQHKAKRGSFFASEALGQFRAIINGQMLQEAMRRDCQSLYSEGLF